MQQEKLGTCICQMSHVSRSHGLSQADAAWVRNVIADSENFLRDLLREVP